MFKTFSRSTEVLKWVRENVWRKNSRFCHRSRDNQSLGISQMHWHYSSPVVWSMMMIVKNLRDESTVSTWKYYWTSSFLFLICLTATSRQPKQFGWQKELTLEREDPHKKDFWTRKCRMRVYRESHDMEVAKQRR